MGTPIQATGSTASAGTGGNGTSLVPDLGNPACRQALAQAGTLVVLIPASSAMTGSMAVATAGALSTPATAPLAGGTIALTGIHAVNTLLFSAALVGPVRQEFNRFCLGRE